MNAKLVTSLIFGFILLFAVDAVADWTENFEGYPAGAPPGFPWTYSGSGDISVTNLIQCEGSQSLQFQGPVGGCWESIPCRPLEVSTSGIFSIEFCVYVSSNHVQGCHPWTGGAGLITECDWVTGASVPIIGFSYDGQMSSRIGQMGDYSYDAWFRVKMKYERLNPSTARISYWIDNVFKGTQVFPLHRMRMI